MISLIFNGNVVFPVRARQFQRFLDAVNIKLTSGRLRLDPVIHITRIVQPSLCDAWISGVTDAEGCYNVSITTGGRIRATPCFTVYQKHDDNKYVLERVASLFGFSPNVVKERKGGVFEIRIRGIKNVTAIFEYFDSTPLRSKKLKSYELFKKLQKMMAQKDHLKEAKISEMIIIASMVNPGSKGRYRREINSIIGKKELVLLKE